MAIAAGGSIRAPGFYLQAVNAGTITVGLPLVTRRAVYGLENLIIVGMLELHIHVATNAGIGAVHGRYQFDFIDE